jgi:hypothetical protein
MNLPNYAGRDDVDSELIDELTLAGISVNVYEFLRKSSGEVKTAVIGGLHGWSFRRAWSYWIATGPGIPIDDAMVLHEKHGKVVRADGHCGSPSPFEMFYGLGCGSYHVDSLIGLKALADTIKQVVARAEEKYKK